MRGFAFRKNSTFEWNGETFRIREMPPNDELVIEAVNTGTMSIVARKKLMTEYLEGRLSAAPDHGGRPPSGLVFSRPLDELAPAVREEVRRRLHYLRAIQADGPPVFTSSYLKPLVQSAALELGDEKPPSVTTLYRWHKRCLHAGQDHRALIPRIDRRGRKAVAQSARVLELMAAAVADAFKASPGANGKSIHSRLVSKIDAENRGLLLGEKLVAPCLRTTYRLLQRADAYEMVTLKDGKAAADQRFRIGKPTQKSTRILERVEVDHTPLDLFIVDERTWLPLGRPTLTMLIDTFSRMPLGYYLSFDGPSALAVVGALRHAVLFKTLTTTALPDLPIENDWPCHGIPEVLVVDNGLEFHGVDLEGIAFDLGITILYCPKREPRFKGTIERYLKTINHFFTHQLPGTSFARYYQRGDYDPQKCALFTFGQFKQVFEKWLVDVYANTLHRGINTLPRQRWNEGAAATTLELPGSLTLLKRRIGRNTERKLRRNGFELNGIRYCGDTLSPILRRFGEGVAVRVVFDPEDLGEVQVWGPEDADPVLVRAVDYEYAKGLTGRQNELVRRLAREAGEDLQDSAALHRALDAIACQVKELMTSQKLRDRKRSATLRGISSTKADASIDREPVQSSARLKASATSSRPPLTADVPPLPEILRAFEMLPTEVSDEAE